METFHEQMMFGDSLSVFLPNDAKDVSEIREIPDNQEVFTHSQMDQSVIFEILEYVKEDSHQQAMRTHFEDVCLSNEVGEDSEIITIEAVPADRIQMEHAKCVWYLKGCQRVAKFNEDAKNTVEIHMALFRLPQFDSDILVTFNNPLEI
ncbi:ran guanine nucleotide release factor, partial [Lingula anatina]|uniref:Ran guanine nucleotide release factor n=1 Tax=Lingula anatina TaxID=7574 RepID=A0A2R2MMS4_LINAN